MCSLYAFQLVCILSALILCTSNAFLRSLNPKGHVPSSYTSSKSMIKTREQAFRKSVDLSMSVRETGGKKKKKDKKKGKKDRRGESGTGTIDLSEAPADFMSNHLDTVDLSYPGIKCLSLDPPIFTIKNFFTGEECDRYIDVAQSDGYLIESKTFSSYTEDHRKSTTWFLMYDKVMELVTRAHKLTGKDIKTFEEPQIVRYIMGDRFLWHLDALPKATLAPDGSDGGQRVATLLVYLNDVPVGGATTFKELDIKVRPVKGQALLFFPSYSDGTSDDRTLHAGAMAIDEKWIAQMWIHVGEYPPQIPPGNKHPDPADLPSYSPTETAAETTTESDTA